MFLASIRLISLAALLGCRGEPLTQTSTARLLNPATQRYKVVSEGINEDQSLGITIRLTDSREYRYHGAIARRSEDGKQLHLNVIVVPCGLALAPPQGINVNSTETQTDPADFTSSIPHDWSTQPSIEVILDGLQSLGIWQQEGAQERR